MKDKEKFEEYDSLNICHLKVITNNLLGQGFSIEKIFLQISL